MTHSEIFEFKNMGLNFKRRTKIKCITHSEIF
jgi:hypothetical protein